MIFINHIFLKYKLMAKANLSKKVENQRVITLFLVYQHKLSRKLNRKLSKKLNKKTMRGLKR